MSGEDENGEDHLELSFPLSDPPSRIVSMVSLGSPLASDDDGLVSMTATQPVRAVWDTGAPYTMAVPSVIEAAGLTAPHGFRRCRGIDGGEGSICPVFHANILLPYASATLSVHFASITMLETDEQLIGLDGEGVHMLLGMDLISRGSVSLKRRDDGRLWFTFREEL